MIPVACSERALGGPLSDEERPAALNNLANAW
jgi:hypothetical protein